MMKKIYISIGIVISIILAFPKQILAQESNKTIAQIQLLLQEKQSRTPVQRKISSQLLQAVREKAGKKMVDGVALNFADVEADATGVLKVDIRAQVTDSLLTALKKLGGKIIYASEKYNAIRAELNLSTIETIATYKAVQFIGPAVIASVFKAGQPNIAFSSFNTNSFKTPANKSTSPTARHTLLKERMQRVQTQLERYLNSGTINSQGDHAHRADDVRTTYGVQGQGIRIGVLSDSYNATNGATADVYNGNLPGTGNPFGYTMPVTVLVDDPAGEDEGRAMLQIVHDLAPKAQLFFATADVSEASFATNITTLKSAYNCDIIIDDIFYVDEPQFQDGIVAQAVNTVTAAGALYFSSAGNEGSVTKGTAGIWEGDFNDAGSLPFTSAAISGTIHNWGTVTAPVNGNIITAAGQYYGLNWSDPAYASTNDYDLFLVSAIGIVKSSSTDDQSVTHQAFEGFNTTAFETGDRLVVFKSTSAQVRAFSLNTFRGKLTKFTTGQTHGHSAAIDAFSVAAASALQTSGAPFATGNVAESFTSDGPRRMFYTADGTAVTPDNVLFATNGGLVRNKPDITAADGVSTSLPLNQGLNPFYGTSAAAPHAGAIAALIKSAKPTITPAEMRTLLTSTALDIESAGYDNITGYGIIQAFKAMQTLNPTPLADISLVGFTPIEAAGGNKSGAIDPGERINLVVNLKNTSLITASNVTATLTTSTSGVTISTTTANYGSVAAAASASNSSSPFVFTVSNSVLCGTQLNFTVTVSFGNGGASPQSFPVVIKVGNQPIVNIAAALGTPAASTAQFTSSTGTQVGRINRFPVASVCGIAKTATLATATGNRTYDAYTFTNNTTLTQCVSVTFSTAANSVVGTNVIPLLYTAAYNNNGFLPATPDVNFLSDSGSSAFNLSYNFSVNANTKYTIVVHELNPTTALGSNYYLNINSNACSNVILPVTWLDFNAVDKNGQAALEWKVANEINVNNYEVEHSTDGNNFTKIYTLPAQGGTNQEKTYTQIHPFPNQGNNYYRIKEVDKDGHFIYSKTVLIVIGKVNEIVVTPTIASSIVTIQSKNIINTIKVYNAVGQLMLDVAPLTNTYNLPINQLAAGPYYLNIVSAKKTYQQKIIKE